MKKMEKNEFTMKITFLLFYDNYHKNILMNIHFTIKEKNPKNSKNVNFLVLLIFLVFFIKKKSFSANANAKVIF